jgi:hypothetical protein
MDSYRGDGLNLYAYVQNNPINYIDPSGYCGEKSNGSTESEYIENQFSKYDIGDRTLIFANNGEAFLIEIEEWKFSNGERYKGFKFVNSEDRDNFSIANKVYVSPKQWFSHFVGISKIDIIKDFADLIAGKDLITGEKTNRWLLAVMIIAPEAIDQALKKGAKTTDQIMDIAKKSDALTSLKKGKIIASNPTKKGFLKIDYLFDNMNDAKEFGRDLLGHDATRIYDDAGKWIGWQGKKGKVYWGHGDWGKGVGSSSFPHLNYDIDGVSGHLYLQDKIQNRDMWEAFNKYFGE